MFYPLPVQELFNNYVLYSVLFLEYALTKLVPVTRSIVRKCWIFLSFLLILSGIYHVEEYAKFALFLTKTRMFKFHCYLDFLLYCCLWLFFFAAVGTFYNHITLARFWPVKIPLIIVLQLIPRILSLEITTFCFPHFLLNSRYAF